MPIPTATTVATSSASQPRGPCKGLSAGRAYGSLPVGGNPVTPVPLTGTVCGLPAASSATATLALRLSAAVGVKVTRMVQKALAASVLGQLLLSEKSPLLVPLSPMPVMVRAALPLLIRVTVDAALVVLTCWFPKLKVAGFRLTSGANAIVAEPLKATGGLASAETGPPALPT